MIRKGKTKVQLPLDGP